MVLVLFQITRHSKAQHKYTHRVICDADSQLSSHMLTKEGVDKTGNFLHFIFWICSSHALNFVTCPPHFTVVEMASQGGEIICSVTQGEENMCLSKKYRSL